MSLSTLLPFLLALARAVPAIDSLVAQIVAERSKDREREAAQRLNDKKAAITEWIATGKGPS